MHSGIIRVSFGSEGFTHKYEIGLLSWYIQCWDIVQSDRKRALSVLPNESHPKLLSAFLALLGESTIVSLAFKGLKNTVFTRMQSFCNLRHPKNKTSKEKYFTINFIHLIHTACHILSTFTNQCYCLHLHSQCFHLPDTPS